MTELDRLLTSWRRLGTDERTVVALVAERLAAGRETYGELAIATDRRDFGAEAAEELVDAVVYLAVETLRQQQRGHN